MDAVFKALSDPTRRQLLDSLRARDGQTLTQLEGVHGMTRFGVMKHLGVLESAGLVVTRRIGRFKYHYLNALPLQEAVDRWIEPLMQKPLARAALNLKTRLEGSTAMPTDQRPDFVMETWIRTTPEKLWEALTTEGPSGRYNFMAGAIHGDFVAGGRYRHKLPNGDCILSGTVFEARPPVHLDVSFEPGWMGPDAPASRVVYEIEAQESVCRLTILHYNLPAGQEGVKQGWARIVSNLKTYLETGETLSFA